MARTYTEDEWELADLPRKIAYEASLFDHPRMDKLARARHAGLLLRQAELAARIRRASILDRWVMRRYRTAGRFKKRSPQSVLTPMLMDEAIEDGKIIDRG